MISCSRVKPDDEPCYYCKSKTPRSQSHECSKEKKERKRCYWKGQTKRVISATCKMETSGQAEINVPKREYRHAANSKTTPPRPAPGWSLLKLPEALGSVLDLRPEPKFRSGSLFRRPSAPPEATLPNHPRTAQPSG
jgi:hypothetical protein